MNERLARHFIRRLERERWGEAISQAVEAGILASAPVEEGGQWPTAFLPGSAAKGRSPAAVAAMLARRCRYAGTEDGSSIEDPFGADFVSSFFDERADGEGKPGTTERKDVPEEHGDAAPASLLSGSALLKLVRRSAPPLRAADVAALLHLASGVERSFYDIATILDCLRLPAPIIAITGETTGFEEKLLELLMRGLVLPQPIGISDGYQLQVSRPPRFSGSDAPQVIVFSSSRQYGDDRKEAARQLGEAAQTGFAVLGLADDPDKLPPLMEEAAQLVIHCGPLTSGTVRRTIETVLQETPPAGRPACDCACLALADIALAVRPGISAEQAVMRLESIAAAKQSARTLSADDDGDDEKGRLGRGRPRSRSREKGTGSTIIQPEPVTVNRPTGETGEAAADREAPKAAAYRETAQSAADGEPNNAADGELGNAAVIPSAVLTVETLSGFGAAREWALGLKDDLTLWRDGKLAWEEMSTKLLLSGPPGTGKTTFARALCNTLQAPLIATSVATWLEPGYLGDVISGMKRAFAEAEKHAPSILFIDEFDGIGRRDRARDYDDYWTTVINRLLELLDGTARTTGVIVVGAANNPAVIDSALVRSGRLEKHIAVPLPDTTALMGILRHHLKDDLASVIASAPAAINTSKRADKGDTEKAGLIEDDTPTAAEQGGAKAGMVIP